MFPTFGPFTDDAAPLEFPRASAKLDANGMQSFLVFIPVQGELQDFQKGVRSVAGTYDLTEAGENICVRMTHTAMPRATFSNIVTVPAAKIAEALAAEK